ncbi:MAG: tetratricopeptide repeat protein [Nitrospirae bacterium]|nr:tetratricopeptide repeat protein [Nitrospirota bacterium]
MKENYQRRTKSLILMALLIITVIPLSICGAFAQSTEYQSFMSGLEHYKFGQYKEALEDFEKASVILPGNADISYFIGLTQLHLGDSEKAIENFKKSLDMKPSFTNAHFQLGIILVQKKDYQNAVSHLEYVYKEDPQREDLGYFLGFAYYQLGQYEKSLYYLEKVKTKNKNIASLTIYYKGLANQQLHKNSDAVAAYKDLIIKDPASPLAEPAKRLIETTEIEQLAKKRFNIEFTTKLQYDDNVLLIPTTNNVINLNDKGKKSMIELLYLRGEYFLVKEPDLDLSASYALYQTIADDIRRMDVQDHIFSVDLSKRGTIGSMSYDLRSGYSYDYLLSDYKYFLQRHTVRPAFLLAENRNNLSVLQYTLQFKEFAGKPDFSEDNRDAVNHEVGLVHFIRSNDAKHYIKAGYFWDKDFAQGSDWSYAGNRLTTGLQYTFPKDIRFNLDYDYKWYHYDNTDFFFGVNRMDIERTLNAVFSKDIGKNWIVSLEYLRRRNSSNIDLYDYTKNLYSMGLSWRW